MRSIAYIFNFPRIWLVHLIRRATNAGIQRTVEGLACHRLTLPTGNGDVAFNILKVGFVRNQYQITLSGNGETHLVFFNGRMVVGGWANDFYNALARYRQEQIANAIRLRKEDVEDRLSTGRRKLEELQERERRVIALLKSEK